MSGTDCDVLVVGAGIVGIAAAREIAMAGYDPVLVEPESMPLTDTSSRNSEVIHSGIYYQPGSLKAKTCVTGRERLYAYLKKRNIPHERLGKLVVSCDDYETFRLADLLERARQNGVHSIRRFSSVELNSLAPDLYAEAALYAPETGIVDIHELGMALLTDAMEAGCSTVYNTKVIRISLENDKASVLYSDRDDGNASYVTARYVVVAAGHGGCGIYHETHGADAARKPYRARFAKGNYATVSGEPPCSMLVYPVPQKHGLGVHLTTNLAGQVRLGPDVQWVNSSTDYSVDEDFGSRAKELALRYWPSVCDRKVSAQYAGIRPKLELDGQLFDDFRIEEDHHAGNPRVWHLLGIESPGLTSCMELGSLVAERVKTAV